MTPPDLTATPFGLDDDGIAWVRATIDAMSVEEKVGQLESALERRAVIERAKGILMERHGLAERDAFDVMRDHARSQSRRVVDVAVSVTEGHALLPKSS